MKKQRIQYVFLFYGISIIIGYLVPNPVFTYILNIVNIWKYILLVHTVKW